MSKTLPKLGAAFDKQSYEWLVDENEDIAAALAEEVSSGATPEDVRRFVMTHIGSDRTGMAMRCMSAARFLERNKQGV